jgi:hypothetical protein
MRRPLGCLTVTAVITALAATVLVMALALITGNAIFSPGALNAVAGEPLGGARSHGDLEARCDACHPAPWEASRMADRCLSCHTRVATEISSGAGLHGLLSSGGECRPCHTDHHGATGSLTVANPSGFPHDRTGYFLTAHPIRGQGGTFNCSDCHSVSLATFSDATCNDCHQQLAPGKMTLHVATFGERCLACHDGIDTYGATFAHLTWPLVGQHAEASCGGCHSGARDLVVLRDTTSACVSCHGSEDIHAGRLGTSCEECHSAATWSDATIDHDRTTFPLTGRHIGIACELCHVDHDWTGLGTTCVACHAGDDAHQGRFGTDCGACHQTSDWTDVTFDHAATGFPLAGGHAGVSCQACHPGGAFAGTPTTCFGCHAGDDAHGGSLGTNCGSCHRPTQWSDVTFDHSKTKFPLTGAHASASCAACHPGGVFKALPITCVSCHTRPSTHTSQFTSCGACHTTRAWLPATFAATHSFPMKHGGAGGVCTKCHPSTWAAWTCVRCHSNAAMASVHSGVSGYTSTGCVQCHPKGGGGD